MDNLSNINVQINISEPTSFTFVSTATTQSGVEATQPMERELPSSVQKLAPEDQSDTTWLAAHIDEVTAKYAGKWVLISGGKVLAASINPAELEKKAQAAGIYNPLITEIAKEPAVWKTAYAP